VREIPKAEGYLCVLAIGVVLFIQVLCERYGWTRGGVWLSILSMVVGGFMIGFGFWGSDYAYSVRIGEVDQSNQRNGLKGMVYVPFMRNYTPTEWWNLNWLITFLGFVTALGGALGMGIYLAHAGLI
jgi:hypothetical protein